MSEPKRVFSESYNPGACCGADCFAIAREDEPCWGDVSPSEEVEYVDADGGDDFYWVHECEGHLNCWDTSLDEGYKEEES